MQEAKRIAQSEKDSGQYAVGSKRRITDYRRTDKHRAERMAQGAKVRTGNEESRDRFGKTEMQKTKDFWEWRLTTKAGIF